jgi:dTDP-glucose pyrophosphorylase
MFMHAIDSLEKLVMPVEIYVVIREDMDFEYFLKKEILNWKPEVTVIVLKEMTGGSAQTALKASCDLNPDLPLLILDCDLKFESTDFLTAINNNFKSEFDGVLLAFQSVNPRYSYVLEEENIAIQVAEKLVISNRALIGAYFWSRCSDFNRFANEVISEGLGNLRKEYYVSRTIQKAISKGFKFSVIEGEFDSFGTPEELAKFLEGESSHD